jgi:hypothetical protein
VDDSDEYFAKLVQTAASCAEVDEFKRHVLWKPSSHAVVTSPCGRHDYSSHQHMRERRRNDACFCMDA